MIQLFLSVGGLLKVKVQKLKGWAFLGSPSSIYSVAADLVLVNQPLEESKRNVALSHVEGDKLVINRGKGYQGGGEIDGNVNIKDNITICNWGGGRFREVKIRLCLLVAKRLWCIMLRSNLQGQI
ncbi:MAG: hypothetical protein WBM99_06240, partial [Psychromonas sp.]